MWNKFKASIIQWMSGRYGADEFHRFLFWTYVGLFAVNLFWRNAVLYVLSLVVLLYALFRLMSRNFAARRAENAKFLEIRKKCTDFFSLGGRRWRERKTHVYRKCPSCRVMLRLPRVKGEHTVRCPHCGNRFDLKI